MYLALQASEREKWINFPFRSFFFLVEWQEFADLTDLIFRRRFGCITLKIKLSKSINLTRISWSCYKSKKGKLDKNFALSKDNKVPAEVYMLSSLPLAAHSHVEKFTKYLLQSSIIWRTAKSFNKHLSRFNSTQKERKSIRKKNDDDEMRILSFLWLAMHILLFGPLFALPNRRRSVVLVFLTQFYELESRVHEIFNSKI